MHLRSLSLCTQTITNQDLQTLSRIAKADLDYFAKSKDSKERSKVVAKHIFSALAADGGEHYVNSTGFRCMSIWHFFEASDDTKAFHPRRRRRVDFGSDKFGFSCWNKHPEDSKFVGKGVNLFGRSIEVQKNESPQDAVSRHLAENPKNVPYRELHNKHMVVVWPPAKLGTTFKV